MIFITTSNGVFHLDSSMEKPEVVLQRDRGFLFFRKGSRGFFGVSYDCDSNEVLVASRECLGTPAVDKKATDTKIFGINPTTKSTELKATIYDVHDVHQMSYFDHRLFLTDTGKNRVVVYDLQANETLYSINVGPERKDIHHLNASYADGEKLLVGLNNRGTKDSEILSIPMAELPRQKMPDIDATSIGKIQVMPGLQHTHDIQPFGDSYLVCSSHEGRVYRQSDMEAVINAGDWARGMDIGSEGLWLGHSPIAERSQRHREDLDGKVSLYDKESFNLIKQFELVGAGQVNDILAVEND